MSDVAVVSNDSPLAIEGKSRPWLRLSVPFLALARMRSTVMH